MRRRDLIPLREHLAALRDADLRFEAERDRRYSEVALARAEALRIKEEGDRRALELAREIQDYKDEKANELRDQIGAERGLYATKEEIRPFGNYLAAQTGSRAITAPMVATLLFVAAALVSIAAFIAR